MPLVVERPQTRQPLQERALEAMRQAGNPFRNCFARHPDDEVCARYHVPELYAREREQLLAAVDLYRGDAAAPSEVVPILGAKGAGKTHLLHSLKHGPAGGRQLLVTPGSFQKGADFAEYLLFQIIDTLLGGGKQRGKRPIEFVGEELTRRLLRATLLGLDGQQRLDLFPVPALARWVRRLGLGTAQADERTQWLIETLSLGEGQELRAACQEAQLDLPKACDAVAAHLDRTEPLNAAGQMRRRIGAGFVRATLLGEERPLAEFLTDGFASLDFQVRPSRQELALALLKTLMEQFLALKIPVVVAFDQLEDLLLARRTDDDRRVSEAFFAGIVQMMHQADGLLFLVFAERGLWNRFVPSLDGYIQDRLNNPIHLPKFGTIKALRLEAPPAHLVWQVVAARLRPTLASLADCDQLSPIFPFTDDEVSRVAAAEPTLRDMLQQFRRLFDHRIYGQSGITMIEEEDRETLALQRGTPKEEAETKAAPAAKELPTPPVPRGVKQVAVLETEGDSEGVAASKADPVIQRAIAAAPPGGPAERSGPKGKLSLLELWRQEMDEAKAKLEPEGALTGATRELNAGLGRLLSVCSEHGVKVGPWRVTHVAPDLAFGDHPTYGVMTLAHWAGRDGAPVKLGLGLFLGRGPGKPKDLAIKLAAFEGAPPLIDQLVLLRPADDTAISGKSKTLWEDAVSQSKRLRLEPLTLEDFAVFYGFPRWLAAVGESLGKGQPLPNLADFLQEHAGALLAQLSLPRAEGE